MSPSVLSGTSSSLNLVRRLGPKVLLSLLVLELLLDGQDAGCRRDQQQDLLHEWYSFMQLVAGHRHAGRCWPTSTRISDFYRVREGARTCQRESQSIREPYWARIGIRDSPTHEPRRAKHVPGEPSIDAKVEPCVTLDRILNAPVRWNRAQPPARLTCPSSAHLCPPTALRSQDVPSMTTCTARP